MNCKQANELSITWFLRTQGYTFDDHGQKYIKISSPFTKDTNPSFFIKGNRFKDYSSGLQGRTLDLAMLLWKCDIKEALRRLENLKPCFSDYKASKEPKNTKSSITILEVKPIKSVALYVYLRKRAIKPELAKEYLKEVLFHWQGGKPQFALGWKTNSGSFELRNSILKLSTSPKDITVIPGNTVINLFEGCYDYLSYLQLRNNEVKETALILNSTNNLDKSIDFLSASSQINCFLDNDPTGRKTQKEIEKQFKEKVHDYSFEYKSFKDLNDFLTGTPLK